MITQRIIFLALTLLLSAMTAGGVVWSHHREQRDLNARFPRKDGNEQ